jgi:pimeloyl-ACP methyl ester carboxylesterase
MRQFLIIILFLFQTIALHAKESVVCLHGFFRSYRCMIPIANVARNEGANVYLWDYPSRSKTIEDHAAALVEVLNIIAKQNPNEPIHFVTHSLGGVIVRAALCSPDCPQEAKIGKAVLLAPPNKGARLARRVHGCPIFRKIFGKKAGYQLMTYTEEDMENIGSFPESKQVMVIAGTKESRLLSKWMHTPNDGKVTVEETRLSTPHRHHVLHVAHSWIMTSRESISLTRGFLFSKETQEATAVECVEAATLIQTHP